MPQNESSLIVGLDVDGVVADFVAPILSYCRVVLGKKVYEQDITSFNMASALGEDAWEIAKQQLVTTPGFASCLSLYPQAAESIAYLRTLCRVVFVTSPYQDSQTWTYDRTNWLVEKLNTRVEDIVYLQDKTLFTGCVLVDDSPKNLKAWVENGGIAIRMVRPWNEGALGRPARTWADVVQNVESIISDSYDPKYLTETVAPY